MSSIRDSLPASLRTERLILRAPVASDVPDIVAMANNPKMLLTTATLPHPFGPADAEDFLQEAASGTKLHAYALTGEDDRFMGTLMFKYAPGKAPEISYWLGEPHWGKGYAGEAISGLLQGVAGLRGFEIIDARVLASNPASVRVLEKAGFAIIEHTHSVVERHRGKPVLVLRWSAS